MSSAKESGKSIMQKGIMGGNAGRVGSDPVEDKTSKQSNRTPRYGPAVAKVAFV